MEEVKVDLEQNKLAINLRNLRKESGRNGKSHVKSQSVSSNSRNDKDARFKLHSNTATPQSRMNAETEE